MPRLSGEEGSPSLAGPSSAPEMRQKNSAFVDPLFVKPQVYYGEGPFDPPSSDDEDEATLAPHPDHHSDDDDDDLDSEQFSLLTIDKSGPATPGRAERGEPSPRRPEYEEPKVHVLQFFGSVLVLTGLCRKTMAFASWLLCSSVWCASPGLLELLQVSRTPALPSILQERSISQ